MNLFEWIIVIVFTPLVILIMGCLVLHHEILKFFGLLKKHATPRNRISYYHWIREQNEKENSIRPMRIEDVSICVDMTLESFGYDKYPEEQFNTIEEEFNASFEPDWWGRPKYFVCEYRGNILGMGGYQLSPLDWDTFEFFWLSVRKGYEGYGIGKMLVEHREKEILKESTFKKDITVLFSCTKEVIKYHKKNGYKVLLNKAGGDEVIMGKTFLKNKDND